MLRKWWLSHWHQPTTSHIFVILKKNTQQINIYTKYMKELGSGQNDAIWNDELVAQLGFIKKHLRYPISKRTAKPLSLLALLLPGIAFLIYTALFTRSTSNYNGK